MIIQRIQAMIDEVHSTAWQQWSIRALGFAAAVVASLAADIAARDFLPMTLVFVVLLAAGSLVRPDSHAGIGVFVVVCWRWLAGVDDVRTPWSMVVAVALLAFHVATSAAAITPPGGHVSAVLLRRWAVRSTAIVAATIGGWGVLVVLADRSMGGNALLTVLALAVAIVGWLVLRARTIAR